MVKAGRHVQVAAANRQGRRLHQRRRLWQPVRGFWHGAANLIEAELVTADGDVKLQGRAREQHLWRANLDEAGQVIYAHQSVWLAASLLNPDQRAPRGSAGRSGGTLAGGGRPEAIAATRDFAMNPAPVDAFALAICGADDASAYPGVPGTSRTKRRRGATRRP